MPCGPDPIEGARTPQLRPNMHIRTRKLIGTVALLVLVVVWALLAMGFAQMIVAWKAYLY